MKHKFVFALVAVLTYVGAHAQAAAPLSSDSDTIEMSYEDLVDELAAKKNTYRQSRSSSNLFNQIQVHSGFGLVQSFSQFNINGSMRQRYQNGMQLALGVDLMSPQWFAETAWRNFGVTHNGSEEHTLREWLLKFGYKDMIQKNVGYRLQGGLSNRFLKVTDSMSGFEANETTPHFYLGGGLALQLNKYLSINFDVSARTPVISQTVDRGSIDGTIDLKISM